LTGGRCSQVVAKSGLTVPSNSYNVRWGKSMICLNESKNNQMNLAYPKIT